MRNKGLQTVKTCCFYAEIPGESCTKLADCHRGVRQTSYTFLTAIVLWQEVIMGRSLYNRIHLGRRHALFNLRRLKAAAGFLSLSILIVLWMVATYE